MKRVWNRLHYTLIAIAVIILIGVGVYAFGGSSPSTMGHSVGEIAPPAGCTAGQSLQWNGASWTCSASQNNKAWSGVRWLNEGEEIIGLESTYPVLVGNTYVPPNCDYGCCEAHAKVINGVIKVRAIFYNYDRSVACDSGDINSRTAYCTIPGGVLCYAYYRDGSIVGDKAGTWGTPEPRQLVGAWA